MACHMLHGWREAQKNHLERSTCQSFEKNLSLLWSAGEGGSDGVLSSHWESSKVPWSDFFIVLNFTSSLKLQRQFGEHKQLPFDWLNYCPATIRSFVNLFISDCDFVMWDWQQKFFFFFALDGRAWPHHLSISGCNLQLVSNRKAISVLQFDRILKKFLKLSFVLC